MSANKQIIKKWTLEQCKLRQKLILYDTELWQFNKIVHSEWCKNETCKEKKCLRYIAGLDISFLKGTNLACCGLVVCDISEDMKIVYEDIDEDFVEMKYTYQAGFLAYRESPFLMRKLEKLKEKYPELYPQCIFIDGNGLLHHRGFGLASHIGYFCNTPTIGCCKSLLQVQGLRNDVRHKNKVCNLLKKGGDFFELISDEDECIGLCYRSTNKAQRPIYVSIGHKISWLTILSILKIVTKYRVPEPIRIADIKTRERIRKLKGG